MILLYTDFGWQGPYVGEMHAAIRSRLPAAPIVDLMHDAPAFDPISAGILLAALSRQWREPVVVVAVVDPGVGTPRLPLAVRVGPHWLVGPDNGLLLPTADRLSARYEVEAEWYVIEWRPDDLSASFHGRDLFSPVAVRVWQGDTSALSPLSKAPTGEPLIAGIGKIIYADRYGNLVTGIPAAAGGRVTAGHQQFGPVHTFADAAPGQAFWYNNSMGLIEIAVNQGSARDILGLSPGDAVSFQPIQGAS